MNGRRQASGGRQQRPSEWRPGVSLVFSKNQTPNERMRKPAMTRRFFPVGFLAAAIAVTGVPAHASSHREAPGITKMPKVDGTDFYVFNSYEAGRAGDVTFLANYVPLQDAYGGPNFFTLDPDAVYRIHVDNAGNGVESLTFEFRV